jgi:hypothetical protein
MNIILIDDSQKEIDKYSGIFRSNKFAKKNFTLVAVVLDSLKPDFQFSEKPDLILIDFRFDLPGGEGFYHDGYVLATALRNIYNEIPILIFTRRGIFNIQKFPNSIVDIADDIVFKSDFIKNEDYYLNQFHSIILGYSDLNKTTTRNWETLVNLLKAPTESINDLLNSDKPNLQYRSWTVIDSANWIRKTLFKYPGILYNKLYASAYLGISIKAFNENLDLFNEAIYSGIFNSKINVFWKTKLRSIAVKLMQAHEINLPINLGFSKAFEITYGKKIEPSICVSSGEDNAEKICYILKKPVKTKFSFSYNVDDRPRVMDEARVSWEAIRTTNDVNEDLLNPIAREMLENIKGN